MSDELGVRGCQVRCDEAAEGVAAAMKAAGYFTLGRTAGERKADIGLVAEKRMRLFACAAAFGATDGFAFRFESREGFSCPLADERSFNLGREAKSESQDFGLKIIPEAVTVFDGPNRTTAVHAETEDLHDHVEVSAQTAEFATDDEIAFVDMVEQFAQLSFGIRLCA